MPEVLARLFLIFALIYTHSGSLAVEQSPGWRLISEPRNYGITIGDELRFLYRLSYPQDWALDDSSLRSKTDLDYWLQLKSARYGKAKTGYGRINQDVELIYQVFYAPLDVRQLTLPASALIFQTPEETSELSLPEWHFHMSPIKEITPRGVGARSSSGPFMRPFTTIPDVSTAEYTQSLLVLSSLVLLLLLAIAICNGWFSAKMGREFRQARKLVRHYRKSQTGDYLQILRLIHEGFNRVHGRTVFSGDVDQFLQSHPEYNACRDSIVRFFRHSDERAFLHPEQEQEELQLCTELCTLMLANRSAGRLQA